MHRRPILIFEPRWEDAYDDLVSQFGTFSLVVSLEVIEHCFDPQAFAVTFLSLLDPGGIGFLSTPYHSYLKNLVLAASGSMDRHFTALWPGGHIKFFSKKTLGQLLAEAGAKDISLLASGQNPDHSKIDGCYYSEVGIGVPRCMPSRARFNSGARSAFSTYLPTTFGVFQPPACIIGKMPRPETIKSCAAPTRIEWPDSRLIVSSARPAVCAARFRILLTE